LRHQLFGNTLPANARGTPVLLFPAVKARLMKNLPRCKMLM